MLSITQPNLRGQPVKIPAVSCDGLFLLRRPFVVSNLIFMPLEPMHVRPSQSTRAMLVVRPQGMGIRCHLREDEFGWFFFPQSLTLEKEKRMVRHA